jgi:ubiquinone biosynthesis protein COQ9
VRRIVNMTKICPDRRRRQRNIVQSIRAFRVQDLQDSATRPGQHFLYANLATAQSKQDVLDMIAAQFTFPAALRQELRRAVRLHDGPAA